MHLRIPERSRISQFPNTAYLWDMIMAGQTIRASRALQGDYFEDTQVILVKHNAEESIGFITNRPFGKNLNDLTEFMDCDPLPLWEGGPVGQDHLYLIHCRPDLIHGGTPVDAGWYWGGRMDDLRIALLQTEIKPEQVQLFIGYCGWDAGELDREIAEGSWLPVQNIN